MKNAYPTLTGTPEGKRQLGRCNESSVSTRGKEFLDQLSDYQLSKRVSAH
jgi:hypothetical protein